MRDSLAFAQALLAATGVGLAPGSAFGEGGEGHLRLCFAASLPTLDKALDRFSTFMGDYAGQK
jgi:aspartate/methionine/tyrosine aminotransferase